MARGRDPGYKVIVSLTDRFTKPIQQVNNRIAESTAKIRAMARVPGAIAGAAGLDKIGGAAANVGKAFGNLRNQIAGTIAPFGRLLTLGAGVGLVAATTNAVKLGDEMIKLREKTGLSVESLQEFGYAAKQNGVDAETFHSSVTRLHRSIGEAFKGGKKNEMVTAFKEFGISVKDLQGLGPEETFLRIAQGIADITDPTYRTVAAMKFFGKSGAELIPMLNQGRAGIEQLREELRATGGVMSTETAQKAKAFSDNMLKMQQYIQGVAFSVLDALLPSMIKGVEQIDAWIAANREWLTVEITSVIRSMAEGFKAFVKIIRSDVIPVIESMRPIWDALVAVIGKGNAVLLAFTAVIAPGIIAAVFGIGKAFVALGVAMLANPIGAAIVAIVAVIAGAAYLIYRHWTPIKEFFVGMWNGIKATFDAVVAWLGDFVEAFKADPLKASWDAIAGYYQWLWSLVEEPFNAAIEWLDEFVALFIPGGIVGAWEKLVTVFETVWNAIKAAFNDAWNFIKPIIDKLMAAIGPLIGAIETVIGGVGSAAGAISNVVGGAASAVGSAASGASAAVSGATGWLAGR